MPNKSHYSSNWMDMMVIKLLSKSRCVNLVIIELRDYERKSMEISHLLATEICFEHTLCICRPSKLLPTVVLYQYNSSPQEVVGANRLCIHHEGRCGIVYLLIKLRYELHRTRKIVTFLVYIGIHIFEYIGMNNKHLNIR